MVLIPARVDVWARGYVRSPYDDTSTGMQASTRPAGAEQQSAGHLQRVVEPPPLGPVVLRGPLLAQRLQDRADGGGALRGEIAADHSSIRIKSKGRMTKS
jgi:hypothetical protein